MKLVINVIRVLVGALFIFSGLVKAIDPLGLSYKMQEFFELWGMTSLNVHTLWMSVAMIAFEIVAGAALLLGWRMKLFSWLLFLLIVFFTLLTGYAYLSGKFKNCGCFGDCIPITAFTSFIKDIVLLVLIVCLLIFRKHIKPVFSEKINMILMILVTASSIWLQLYVLKHLPVVDCLPFKVGNNISEKMKMPADAIPDSVVMTFIYEKAGQRIEFTADQFPDDFSTDTYTFIDRYDKIVRPGKNNQPPIKGFSLSGITGIDSTEIVLNMEYALVLFEEKPAGKRVQNKHFTEIRNLAGQKHIPVFIVTTSVEEYLKISDTDLPVFKSDFTAIRTASRAKQTLYLLKKGRIEGKWGLADFKKALKKVEKLEAQPAQVIPGTETPADSTVAEPAVVQ